MSISCFPRDLTDWVLALLSVSESQDEDEQYLVVTRGLSSSFLPHLVVTRGQQRDVWVKQQTLCSCPHLAWEEIRKRRRAAAPRPSCPGVHPSITRCTGLSELATVYMHARPQLGCPPAACLPPPSYWPCLDECIKTFSQKDECMHEVLNEVYLQNFDSVGMMRIKRR